MSLFAQRATLLVILIIAAIFRFWQIDQTPPGFHFDEAFEGIEAWRILSDPSYRPIFLSGNFGVAPLNAYANALVFGLSRLLGGEAGPTAMRVTSAFFGVLTILTVYALATELQRLPRGIRRSDDAVTPSPSHATTLSSLSVFPLFAAATLAGMRWHIHFSRMGIEPIFAPLLWAGATWLLLHGWRTGQWASFAGCGVLLAASMYAYQGAWVIPFLIALSSIYLLWRRATGRPVVKNNVLKRSYWGLFLAGLIASLLFAPLGWHFWQHPDLLVLRPMQVAVSNAQTATGDNAWRSIWATLNMFNPFGATGDLDPRRNLPGVSALNLWLALPFFLGLGLTLWRLRQTISVILLLSFAGLLLPGMFSEEAPHFHRILGSAAPTALLCAVGLDWLWQAAGFWRQQPGRLWRVIPLHWASVLLLICGMLVSARDYFGRWAMLPDLYYAFDVGLWDVGRRLAATPDEVPIYLTPRDTSHPTLAFAFQAGTPGRALPISFDGRHILPFTDKPATQSALYAVIEHEDFRTPLLLPQVFPDATVQETSPDPWGEVYARFYTRPANTQPQRPPQYTFTAVVGDGIHLAGYDIQPTTLHVGEILYLQLHWLVDAPPQADWTVFTHLLAVDAAGNTTVAAGHDSKPGEGSLPTTRWQTGWRLLDEYQIALPADLTPGVYYLEVGLYQANGAHLPVGSTGIRLGGVMIESLR